MPHHVPQDDNETPESRQEVPDGQPHAQLCIPGIRQLSTGTVGNLQTKLGRHKVINYMKMAQDVQREYNEEELAQLSCSTTGGAMAVTCIQYIGRAVKWRTAMVSALGELPKPV